jgi:hypothetical protein
MVEITFYDSFEDMMEAEQRAREAADARVRPAQAGMKPGQYFINFRYGLELPIFGEILDITRLGVDQEEQDYIDESYAQPHMKFYRPSKCYSVVCPEGEIGDVHLSEIDAIIDQELFAFYRENGWRRPRGDE